LFILGDRREETGGRDVRGDTYERWKERDRDKQTEGKKKR
jgi:hypothetical protein